MSDKYLGEREWKNFSKGAAYKTEPLAKALAELEKAAKASPAAQVEALDEVDKQSQLLLKANKADKALANYLNDLGKAAAKARKEAEQAPPDDEESDDVLLDPANLLAQLVHCRRDPQRKVQFGFVDAKDKQPAVLAMSPKVAGKKLFAQLQEATGVKAGAFGTAWVNDTVLMLQLDKPLGGLLKKVREPVRRCGFRITKAILCNADGSVFEQEDEAPADPARPPGQAEATAQTDAPPTAEPAKPAPGDDPSSAFKARLTALIGQLKDVAPASAQEFKLKASEAGVFARKNDFRSANALLDQAEQLLRGASAAPTATRPAPPSASTSSTAASVDPVQQLQARAEEIAAALTAATQAGHPLAAKLQARLDATMAGVQGPDGAAAALKVVETIARALALPADRAAPDQPAAPNPAAERAWQAAAEAWRQAIQTVDGQINAVRSRMQASGNPDLLKIADRGLPALTDNHKTPVMRALFDVDASTGEARRSAAAKGRVAVQSFAQHIRDNAMVKVLDSNSRAAFGVELTIAPLIGSALDQLDDALGQLLAA